MRSLACFALCAVLTAAASADIYSWTDKNGVKHFSDEPPPEGEPVTDVIVMKESREESESEADAKGEKNQDSKKAKQTNKKVEIYIDPSVDYCQKAMAWFDENKVPYTKHDITASDDELKRFEALNGVGTPLIFVGDQRMDGWNEARVKELLEMK